MRQRPRYTTGWWGIPGGPESRSTMVHVRDSVTRLPVCGAQIDLAVMEYQWCSMHVQILFLECQHCYKWAHKRSWEAACSS